MTSETIRDGILFLCVANSARSQMAEGWARLLAPPGVSVFSAGSEPSQVNPLARLAMAERGIDLASHVSKGLDAIPIERIATVVTLCADEVCPVLTADVVRLHWPLPDPAGASEDAEEALAAFRTVRDEIEGRLRRLFDEPAFRARYTRAMSEAPPSWSEDLGDLALRVRHRAVGRDGGPSLSIAWRGRALARFDCFRRDPHFHIDPDGVDEIKPLPEPAPGGVDDRIGELVARLRAHPTELLASPQDAAALEATCRGEAFDSLLARAEDALRNPPPDFDHLDLDVLHRRQSEKWHTYPPDILPAWVAEMDYRLAEPIRAVLERHLEHWDVGYPIAPRDTGLIETFCRRMSEHFGWEIEPARCEILSEVVQGMYVALDAYAEKGQKAIVQTPIYPPFFSAVRETGHRMLENRLLVTDEGYAIDFDRLEAEVDPDTRVFMLCNPHNPTGRVMTRAELERIAELVLRHDLVVIADEIHADLVYDRREHVPFATLAPEIAARTVTLNSASKSFNIPGLRCAMAHFGSRELHERFGGVYPRHVRGGLGLLGLYASKAAWDHAQPWLDACVAYLQANRDLLARLIAEKLPGAVYHPNEGTYLGWVSCEALDIEGSPAKFFYEHGKVAVSDGRLFGRGWDRYVRVNFATSRAILEQVIDRMASALAR